MEMGGPQGGDHKALSHLAAEHRRPMSAVYCTIPTTRNHLISSCSFLLVVVAVRFLLGPSKPTHRNWKMDSFAITEGLVAAEQDGRESETPVSTKLSEETNKFQRAIAAWRGKMPPSKHFGSTDPNILRSGIDLANTIAKLDSTASDIVAQQRDTLVQRKDLAQKTKDFRKLDDESKLSEYKGLLKGPHIHVFILGPKD